MTKRITNQVEVTPDVFGNYHWKVTDLNKVNNPYGLSLASGYAKSPEVASQQALIASKKYV